METTLNTTMTAGALAASIAKSAVMARADLLRADKAWKMAEGDALEVFIDSGITTVAVPNDDGGIDRVTAEGLDEVRRTVNLEAALSLLNASQLAAVVSQAISISAIDAAVDAGVIPPALAEQIINVKQVKPSIKVTFNARVESKK
jgi:hypothetical protein